MPLLHWCALALIQLALLGQARAEPVQNLAQAYAAAWQKQPAARALSQREHATQARRAVADHFLAAPPSIELGTRTDRYNRDKGNREHELGLVLPLWLPGERSGSQQLAAAEISTLQARTRALQWQLAGEVRQAWWSWQLARHEQGLSHARVESATRLRDDVARRTRAGDLSRADQHQAEGALAAAQAAQAEARTTERQALGRLQALIGKTDDKAPGEAEASPDPATDLLSHPALAAWASRSEAAQRAFGLAVSRSRSNPELMLSTRRERGAVGELTDQTWALALRIPFSGGKRHEAALADANAEWMESAAQLDLEKERLNQELQSALAQVENARQQLAANETRARLALENRGFFEKSFRLGESDLPTRLRIELEAFEAERQATRSRIIFAQSISLWRQALGLLPE